MAFTASLASGSVGTLMRNRYGTAGLRTLRMVLAGGGARVMELGDGGCDCAWADRAGGSRVSDLSPAAARCASASREDAEKPRYLCSTASGLVSRETAVLSLPLQIKSSEFPQQAKTPTHRIWYLVSGLEAHPTKAGSATSKILCSCFEPLSCFRGVSARDRAVSSD